MTQNKFFVILDNVREILFDGPRKSSSPLGQKKKSPQLFKLTQNSIFSNFGTIPESLNNNRMHKRHTIRLIIQFPFILGSRMNIEHNKKLLERPGCVGYGELLRIFLLQSRTRKMFPHFSCAIWQSIWKGIFDRFLRIGAQGIFSDRK